MAKLLIQEQLIVVTYLLSWASIYSILTRKPNIIDVFYYMFNCLHNNYDDQSVRWQGLFEKC